MELITSHINADFDAFASMVSAGKLYPEAEMVFPGSQEKKLRDFLDSFDQFHFKRIRDIDLSTVTRLIIVDTKSPDRLGPLSGILGNPGVEVLIYDHHQHLEGDLHGSTEVIEEVGATTTIISEMLNERGLKPTPIEATLMCMGIYEETGNLLFPSTTERDLRAVAWLLKCGASLNIVANYLRTELNRDELNVLNELTQHSKETAIGSLRVLTATASSNKYLGDAAHLAHRMMDIERIDAVVLMLRMENKILLVGRSRAPEINISEVLEDFGGGGHPTAASATIKEMPLELVEEMVTERLRKVAKPGKFAVDIMTRPVITIDSVCTVKEAEETMTRHGVNVLPVQSDGEYMGVISRENVEKAIFHGFRDSNVMDFTTTDADTADRYTPIRDLESTMIEKNQRFIPVVEDGEIKGAITRTDILRSMYEDYLRRSGIREISSEERRTPQKNLSSMIRNRFPKQIHEVLVLSGSIADSLGYAAYLVGGSVRDMLRGEENLDMDIVVEGDGIVFARKLGEALGARVRPHQRFVTAKIIKDGLRIDVATARTEYYESPAALPKVMMSSIKKDLYRRDFTINTLAVKLNPGEFGRLVDFFGGQRDLKDKSIRVLHNLSFVEDPTRAFRAIRFAERFGFRISKHTENLIRSALKMNLFGRLSGSRLLEELFLIFDEEEPVVVIKRLAGYGLLSVIHPKLEFTEDLGELLVSVHDTIRWFELSFIEESPDKRAIYLSALLLGLKESDRQAVLDRLAAPPRLRQTVLNAILACRRSGRRLPVKNPSLIYKALSPLGIEALLLIMSATEDERKKKAISHYLLELRKIKPALGGEDLKKIGIEPGPIYSKLLDEILHEKLLGRIRSVEDERAFALEYVRSKAKGKRPTRAGKKPDARG